MMEGGNDQNIKKLKLNPSGDSGDSGGSDDMDVDDPLVSIVKQPKPPADKDIVAALYPIVFNLEPYDTETLISELEATSIFQVSDLATSEEHPKAIEDTLWTMYCDAREREIGAKVQRRGEEDLLLPNHLIAAFELRNAILHSELRNIEESEKMEIYDRLVPDLQNPGDHKITVLRHADKVFWDTCLEASKQNYPVCGVGNPGIGKTTTTLYLLQKIIMEEKSPVVYTIRCESSDEGTYYELAPVVKNGQVDDIDVILYSNSHKKMLGRNSPLQNEKAFYVVDPGTFKGSCNDKDRIQARFIMAASNDNSHWGKADFKKDRRPLKPGRDQIFKPNQLRGVFVYGHLWTASQVLAVKKYFLEKYDENEILQLYRMFGGSIRDLVSMTEEEFESDARAALTDINKEIINELIDGRYKFAFKPEEPSSIIIGIGPKKDKPMNLYTVFLKSDYIQELVVEKWLRNSWYSVQNEDNDSNRGNLFEAFVRRRFYTQQVQFESNQVRESHRERPGTVGMKKNYQPVTAGMKVGSERKVLRVSNLAASVRKDTRKEFLFYSKDQSEPLIDMIYRVDDGYEAIQATISKTHDAARDKIEVLKNALDLQSDQTLRIFYAVPSLRYDEFKTEPVNPLDPLDTNEYDFSNIFIYHLSIDGLRQDP